AQAHHRRGYRIHLLVLLAARRQAQDGGANVFSLQVGMKPAVQARGLQDILRGLGQLIQSSPAGRQRTMVRRICDEGVGGDPLQHLRRSGAERQPQRAEYVAIELISGLMEQIAHTYDASDVAAPFSGDGVLEEGLGMGDERGVATILLYSFSGGLYMIVHRRRLSTGVFRFPSWPAPD